VYTVPTGYALILKSIILTNPTASSTNLSVTLTSSTTGYAVYPIYQSLAATSTLNWQGWTVLNQGDTVNISTVGGNLGYWLAGALLPHAPGY
jgi:hypothetical protein